MSPRPRRTPAAAQRCTLFALLIVAAGASLPVAGAGTAAGQSEPSWLQWGGPNRDFKVPSGSLAESWPEGGPPMVWSRPLGPGHSAILVDGGVLYTMYREGNGSGRSGPWSDEETIIALDAATGETIWEYKYPSLISGTDINTSYGAGPHSTPLLVGDRLFAISTDKRFHAFDKHNGEVLWQYDMVTDLGAPPLLLRPNVTAGYGCSPLAYKDTVICTVGGPGQALVAFRQSDGEIVWRGGNFLFSNAPPALIDVEGQPQLAVVGGATVNGMDPDTGELLWSVPHDPGNDLNMTAGHWGNDSLLFVSSAYQSGSRAIRLSRDGDITHAEEVWFSSRVQLMFLNSIRLGDWVYGTDGMFGPKFMTAVNVETGEQAWRERGFGQASMVYADGKFIVMDEDGDLVLTRMSPAGMEILARTPVFDTVSWTVPTLTGTRLYARDREKIVAFELGR
jgi:outer membrane protein assembly factor BamB